MKKKIKITKTNIDLKDFQIDDEALRELMKSFTFVSSKQLAKILGKPNDNSLRASRSNGTGFKAHKDKKGNVYYNLIEVFKELGIKL